MLHKKSSSKHALWYVQAGMDRHWAFYLWFRELFLKNIPTRPVLLLLDGHSTHYTAEAQREAQKGGVIIMYLPPNTTHGAQPLDVSFFGSLKHWSSVCHSYVSENPGKVITKYTFSELFC